MLICINESAGKETINLSMYLGIHDEKRFMLHISRPKCRYFSKSCLRPGLWVRDFLFDSGPMFLAAAKHKRKE